MRTTPSPWLARLELVVFTLASTLACVSGAAEPLEDAGAVLAGADSRGGAGGLVTNAPTGGGREAGVSGAPSALGGASAGAGQGPIPGGAASAAGSSVGGSGTGPTPEACGFPAWMAGHTYEAGDKVTYMGQAFVATEQNPGYDPLISTYFWDPYSCQPVSGGGASSGGSGSGGTGSVNGEDCVLDQLLQNGEATFHAMFVPPWQGHREKELYSYSALCQALGTHDFGAFASGGNLEQDRREVAAFFAHVAKETAFLEQTDEAGQPSTAGDYHGRGAIQLTGQANYEAAGAYLGKPLVQNPGLVSTDPLTNWQVALWFWVVHENPGTAGTKNCHKAISAGDFAQTTRIINGGIECPGSQSAQTRAQYYQSNCGLLSVSAGGNLVC